MTKPKIYDSSRGRARTFMRDDSKTNDVFTMTSLKGQTFSYFARSSDFTEGKRSLPLVGWLVFCLFVCLFVWFFFLVFFWLNLNTFVFPLCEFRLVQWSCRPWLERVPLCPHLAPQSELNLCKVQGLYARFTGYPVFAGFTAVWSVYVRGLKQYKIYIFLSFYVRDLQQYKVRMRGLLPYNTFICIKCARGFNTAL